MGWTGMQPPYHGDKKRWLEEQFNQNGEVGTNPSFKLTDISIRGREAYGILNVVKADGTKTGCGMVMLLECSQREWAIKDMSEDMLPYYYNAPKKLIYKLDELYPATNDNQRKWRNRCLAKVQ